jgi:hypothetical protein
LPGGLTYEYCSPELIYLVKTTKSLDFVKEIGEFLLVLKESIV